MKSRKFPYRRLLMVFALPLAAFCIPQEVFSQQRALHYKPKGTSFEKVSGERKFNRALYGTNTGFRVETGDLPEFAFYMPGMGGNLRFALVKGDSAKWITELSRIQTVYDAGSMIYRLEDEWLGNGHISLKILAAANHEGMLWEINMQSPQKNLQMGWVFGGASGKNFSRSGDIGADPESVFYLHPENCRNNIFRKEEGGFLLSYGKSFSPEERKTIETSTPSDDFYTKNKIKRLQGIFPGTFAQGNAGTSPSFHSITKSSIGNAPVATGVFDLSSNKIYHGSIFNPASVPDNDSIIEKRIVQQWQNAEAARQQLAGRVKLHTPDPWINTLGGTLAIAGDAIWEHPTYLHGAVAWRMRLNAWRGAYVADALGWPERAEAHFSSYALSQLTEPAVGPVVADTALNLARQQEKLGNAMFSSGYICRNPNGDFRPHHYDMNLVFIDQLLTHFNYTGDTAYVKKMWPVIKRHLDWEKRNFDSDNDGLYDAYCCIWASDALQYSGGGVTHSSAYNYRSNKNAAFLASIIGANPAPYEKEAERIHSAVNQHLWLDKKGWFAEYKDAMGLKRTHDAPGLWTIYHALESGIANPFQAYLSTRYIDEHIPHIPFSAEGMDSDKLYMLSTSNWQPYTWSVNNVALAEQLHTSLAYWQAGRQNKAFEVWRSALLESMYLGASPGGFQQLSHFDAVRGELYRDFADPVGMAARSLTEGLFGILPDAFRDTLHLHPGLPSEWAFASISLPHISLSFHHHQGKETWNISQRLQKELNLELRLPARTVQLPEVRMNGKKINTVKPIEGMEQPYISIILPREKNIQLEIFWKGASPDQLKDTSLENGLNFSLSTQHAEITEIKDPQHVLENPVFSSQQIKSRFLDSEGTNSFFLRMKQGDFTWWAPVVIHSKKQPEKKLLASVQHTPSKGKQETINLTPFFNDAVTNIFRNKYLSPRPSVPTLQIPTQGIGNWCYPLVQPEIDDAGIRKMAGKSNLLQLKNGLSFATPSTSAKNIAFTSLWDNFPEAITIPLSGKAKQAFFLLTGTTNHMQSQINNGLIAIEYTDGSTDTLFLRNPENWWPIEQDYMNNGQAFSTNIPEPLRVSLKTGQTGPFKYSSIKGFSSNAIDGGAATVLSINLDSSKQLKSVSLRTLSNEVIIGVMGITVVRGGR